DDLGGAAVGAHDDQGLRVEQVVRGAVGPADGVEAAGGEQEGLHVLGRGRLDVGSVALAGGGAGLGEGGQAGGRGGVGGGQRVGAGAEARGEDLGEGASSLGVGQLGERGEGLVQVEQGGDEGLGGEGALVAGQL